jgi:hypothetical protein
MADELLPGLSDRPDRRTDKKRHDQGAAYPEDATDNVDDAKQPDQVNHILLLCGL